MTSKPTSRSRRLVLGACALACAAIAVSTVSRAVTWNGSSGETVQGNGHIQRQAREVGHFSGVGLSLPGNVEVRRGDRESLTIETDDNLLPLIETVVEDGTLEIRSKRGTNLRTRHLKVTVQARDLDHLAMGGSGSIDADRVNGGQVRFDIGGSGTINAHKVEGERIAVNLGGSGDLVAGEGTTRSLSVSIGGSGKVDLAHVRADSASVNLAGSGGATVWVRNNLEFTAVGSGDVSYYGDPQVSKTVMGSGGVRRLGPAPR